MLMCAVHNGHEQVAEVLLATGANVNYAKADDSCTALMYAAQNGHDLCVSALIEYGADVNARNKQGGTALMFATQNGHNLCVDVLIENGAVVAQNIQGELINNVIQ